MVNGGWIILDKDSGVFSKTAAARISRMFGIKKNGHIGTLDPMASGVLPIALGDATKMIPFVEDVSDKRKEYLFSFVFGFETDTLDITGKETNRLDFVPDVDVVRNILPKFIGHISQIPPAFSAIHIDGRRAYDLARRGESVGMPPRTVDIYELEFLGVSDESWNFRMVCSPGTYVRSVARDIAHGVGALCTVNMIRRIRTTGFSIENTVKLDFLEKMFNNGADIRKYLMPVDSGLGGIPVLNLCDKDVVLYKNGGFIKTNGCDDLCRVYSGDLFVGIGAISNGVLRPKRTI